MHSIRHESNWNGKSRVNQWIDLTRHVWTTTVYSPLNGTTSGAPYSRGTNELYGSDIRIQGTRGDGRIWCELVMSMLQIMSYALVWSIKAHSSISGLYIVACFVPSCVLCQMCVLCLFEFV
eukprot:291227_1